MITRRDWLSGAALVGGVALAGRSPLLAQPTDPHAGHQGHDVTAPPDAPTPDTALANAYPRSPAAAPTVAEVRRLRRELGYTPVETPTASPPAGGETAPSRSSTSSPSRSCARSRRA
jgi:hypothetical protein